VQPPPVIIPGAFRLPLERRQKTDVTQEESHPPERTRRLQEVVQLPVPPAAPAFEVHDALPVELQQPPIIKTPLEAYAAATQAVAKRTDFKMKIATLLASKSNLREAILLREILGTPRGLQVDVKP
jgi:hypothetical protein